jgi:hypothetical protein
MEADERFHVLLGLALISRRDVQGRLLWLPEVGGQNYVAVGEVNELGSKVIISGSDGGFTPRSLTETPSGMGQESWSRACSIILPDSSRDWQSREWSDE